MSKQHLLRISLPAGQRFYLDSFRSALAKTNRLPPEFFARDPETGQPIREAPRLSARNWTNPDHLADREARVAARTAEQIRNPEAIPGVRIIGAASWVGILADEYHKPLLDQAIGPALEIVSQAFKTPVPVEILTYEHAIEPQEYPTCYFLREMLLKKGARREVAEADLIQVVRGRIETALAAQARQYGLDCPTEEALDIRIAEIKRPRGKRLKTANGMTNQYNTLLDATFYAHVKLKGFWFAGNMTARGHGRIIAGDYRKPREGGDA